MLRYRVIRAGTTAPARVGSSKYAEVGLGILLFVALTATLPRPLTEYNRTRIESAVTATDINSMLIPMLIGGSQLDPEGLVDRMWLVMGPVLDLTEPEQEYVAEIQRGILRSDLIFPGDMEKSFRLARHPAVQWKLVNMRKHLAGGRE